ncbi:DNA-binding CsgD family transcriptional regulator [Constrictibacter sp. MBR-5]|uniref:LuxR family transcriptional regulator n=1 Tax=Constrictibacter sp. MBR-5 TaxID=3156467 RepID=UPI0033965E60
MISADLDDFIDKLRSAPDLAAIATILEDALKRFGFDRYAYLLIHPPGGPYDPVYIGNYPETWSEHYVANDYVNIDPVMPAATAAIVPINWQELYTRLPVRSAQRRVLDEAGDFGLRGGITVPVHGPGSGFATMNVAANVPDQSFGELWRQNRHLLHLIALYSHEAVTRVGTGPAPRKIPQLAPRERECLLWTARGKTAWEVAGILGLSQETVVHYLKAAAAKLGVHNKTHAVVKAILLGVILP